MALDPEAIALAAKLESFGLDAVDLDMLKRGDMLASAGAKVFAALLQLKDDLAEARRIIAESAAALPNGAFMDAEQASLAFMAGLPAEISAVCLRLGEDRDRARRVLTPFAAAAASYDPDDGDGEHMAYASRFRIRQLRDAREVCGE